MQNALNVLYFHYKRCNYVTSNFFRPYGWEIENRIWKTLQRLWHEFLQRQLLENAEFPLKSHHPIEIYQGKKLKMLSTRCVRLPVEIFLTACRWKKSTPRYQKFVTAMWTGNRYQCSQQQKILSWFGSSQWKTADFRLLNVKVSWMSKSVQKYVLSPFAFY